MSAGSVLQHYVGDPEIRVYGLGACPPGHSKVSHCFPLSFDEANDRVIGVDGLVDLYRQSVPKLNFVGPTMVCPVLDKALEAATARGPNVFTVVLILVDDPPGDDILWWLREHHTAPLSVVVVNVTGYAGGLAAIDGDLPDVIGPDSCFAPKRDLANACAITKNDSISDIQHALLKEIPMHIATWGRVNGLYPPRTDPTPPVVLDPTADGWNL